MEQQPYSMPVAQRVALGNVISPSADSQEEHYNQASIIRGLSTDTQRKEIELRANGYVYSHLKNEWILATEPLMNNLGLNKLSIVLSALGDLTLFSNYDKKDIPKLAFFYFKDNYAEFVNYADEFGLKEHRKKELKTILLSYFLSNLNSAKNAGHRNTIRGVLSENVMARALAGGENSQQKKRGFFSSMNPFGKRD